MPRGVAKDGVRKSRKTVVKAVKPVKASNPLSLELRWLEVGGLVDRRGLVNIPGTVRHMVLQTCVGGVWCDVPLVFG